VLVAAWLFWMTQRPQDVVSSDLEVLTQPAAARGISARLLIGILGNVAVFVPLGAAVARALTCGARRKGDAGPLVADARGLAGTSRPWSPAGIIAGGTGAGIVLSGLIELLQRAQPSRVADWEDVVLNTLGALIGALLAVGWAVWRARRGSFDQTRQAATRQYTEKGGEG
jgi:glycopeptide antibiotics resistance protein